MPRLSGTLSWTAGVLVAGAVGGVVWSQLADPPRYEVTELGTVLTQPAVAQRFGVVVLFVGIGALVGLVAGAVAGLALWRRGWGLVPLVVVVTVLASLLAWRVGLLLGPPDPRTVTGLGLGDTVPEELVVDAVAAFVVWPVAGVLGLLVATWLGPARRDDDESVSDRSEPAPQP